MEHLPSFFKIALMLVAHFIHVDYIRYPEIVISKTVTFSVIEISCLKIDSIMSASHQQFIKLHPTLRVE
jgi:hypothetical protein